MVVLDKRPNPRTRARHARLPGVDPAYQQTTLRQEDDHWWYRGRRRVLAEVLASLPLPDQPRILDAGCGGGGQLPALARLGEVTGVELAAEAAEVARARGAGTVLEGTVERLPFDYASFDLITSLDVIEHTDDDVLALRELLRVIRPGGWLVLTVPAYPRLWSRHDELNHHRRRYTRATLLRATAAAGWAPRRTTHFNSLLLPAAAAVRVLERGDSSQRSDVDRTPAWLNGLLEMPLAVEARLIASGRRLPAGLSLLGVFQAVAD